MAFFRLCKNGGGSLSEDSYQLISGFILKILFKIPFKNPGAFNTTIFTAFSPFCYFFGIKQNPMIIRPIPNNVIKRYRGIA